MGNRGVWRTTYRQLNSKSERQTLTRFATPAQKIMLMRPNRRRWSFEVPRVYLRARRLLLFTNKNTVPILGRARISRCIGTCLLFSIADTWQHISLSLTPGGTKPHRARATGWSGGRRLDIVADGDQFKYIGQLSASAAPDELLCVPTPHDLSSKKHSRDVSQYIDRDTACRRYPRALMIFTAAVSALKQTGDAAHSTLDMPCWRSDDGEYYASPRAGSVVDLSTADASLWLWSYRGRTLIRFGDLYLVSRPADISAHRV